MIQYFPSLFSCHTTLLQKNSNVHYVFMRKRRQSTRLTQQTLNLHLGELYSYLQEIVTTEIS